MNDKVKTLGNAQADILFGSAFRYESAAESSRLERELQAELSGYLDRLFSGPSTTKTTRLELRTWGVTAEEGFPTVGENPVLDWDSPLPAWPDFDYSVPKPAPPAAIPARHEAADNG